MGGIAFPIIHHHKHNQNHNLIYRTRMKISPQSFSGDAGWAPVRLFLGPSSAYEQCHLSADDFKSSLHHVLDISHRSLGI